LRTYVTQPVEKYSVSFEMHRDLDDPVHKLTPNLSKIYVSIILPSVMMQELSYL